MLDDLSGAVDGGGGGDIVQRSFLSKQRRAGRSQKLLVDRSHGVFWSVNACEQRRVQSKVEGLREAPAFLFVIIAGEGQGRLTAGQTISVAVADESTE